LALGFRVSISHQRSTINNGPDDEDEDDDDEKGDREGRLRGRGRERTGAVSTALDLYGTLRHPVHMILRFALLIAITASLGACASSKKSSARIYEGDSPSIHFQEKREAPGGRIGNQTYR
jgi:hypothetical protein